jgi:ABC-2 type transport system permease protein
MWERIREIMRKEFLQTLRNPRMRALLFVPPILQLIIFGYAVNLDIKNVRIAWMDSDQTPESRNLRAAFEGSGYFQIVDEPQREADVQELLDHSDVEGVISIFPGYARDLLRGETAGVQILVDGTNSNTASIVSSYANQILATYAQKVRAARNGRGALSGGDIPPKSPVSAQSRVWFNPELASRVYFVPGVVVNIIALVTIILTSMSIVREREIGTMEQLMVTPIRPVELILGKLLPFGVIGLFEVSLVVSAALLVFGIPMRGSLLLLFGCSALFLLNTLGVGLFLSTVSQTQQQAMMASFFFFMPALLLSGFSFPIANMPTAVQYLTYLNPLRYFMQIVRGLFLKGVGIESLWQQITALAVFGVVILGLSAIRFHKRLD